ncbi:hypothetical protein KP509_08G032000 [Ceratopteris richardii]|uniref:ADP-ribosyl cyclase/cyclic ADP-ribose hydrolase n=1 Tax=Ceratopteris richardii TaxID=49495 RepID=A0A8T2U8X7_CERRI|nr:hypothetical protein KP509_08G032000 [Ceratopteris richardii]
MSQEHDVFICHRGPDTKRNDVSVLRGMLQSDGIKCFVDYGMDLGKSVESEIDAAIQSSRVFILILSPEFATSTWCLDEIARIINIPGARGPNPPRKIVAVFYDVQAEGISYDLSNMKSRHPAKIESWEKALEDVCHLRGFFYDTIQAFRPCNTSSSMTVTLSPLFRPSPQPSRH